MQEIIRRQAGIWRKNRRQIGDTNFESGGGDDEKEHENGVQSDDAERRAKTDMHKKDDKRRIEKSIWDERAKCEL